MSNISCTNWYLSVSMFSLLSCISIIWNSTCNWLSSSSFSRWNKKYQLHCIIIYWLTSALNNIYIFSFNIVLNVNICFSISKIFNLYIGQLFSEILGYRFSQFKIRRAGDDDRIFWNGYLIFTSEIWIVERFRASICFSEILGVEEMHVVELKEVQIFIMLLELICTKKSSGCEYSSENWRFWTAWYFAETFGY